MTTTDANGIVFLEETDAISPFHTLINGLQTATSNAFTTLKARVAALEAKPTVKAETGTYTADGTGSCTISYGVTFASTPTVVCTSAFVLGAPAIFDVTATTTTAFTVKVRNSINGSVITGMFALGWIAVK